MASLYPIGLKIDGRRCLVVGGGKVALRKVRGLLESRARVTVVAPTIDAKFSALRADDAIERIERGFEETDLEGAVLVIAATDDEALNRRVKAEAERRGVLCNVADVPDLCDFFLPSVVRRGSLQIAISTDGKAPALASALRRILEGEIGEEYERVLGAAQAVRERLRDLYPDDSARRCRVMRRLVHSEELTAALKTQDHEKLDAILDSWISVSLD
jgi:precorrin-2 dehydrogenase/sirohydrochlorin ferrochelatase